MRAAPGRVCPRDGCCFKLQWFIRKNLYPTGKAFHGGRRRSERRRKHHHVRGWTRLEPPSQYSLHSSELQYGQGRQSRSRCTWALPRKPSAKPRFLTSSCFKRSGAFTCCREKRNGRHRMLWTSLRSAQRTRQSRTQHAQLERQRDRGWWEVTVVLVVGRSAPARYSCPVRARIVIAYGFCVVFVSGSL